MSDEKTTFLFKLENASATNDVKPWLMFKWVIHTHIKTDIMKINSLLKLIFLTTLVAGINLYSAEELPNILWITCEDTGPQLGCYGDKYSQTPNLDALAAKGVRYRVAWATAPVCAPARTAIIFGVYPTSLGAEHMRSLVSMPNFMRMYPQFLREKGYYCSNNNKEDYNLQKPGIVWDDSSKNAHWRKRKEGQPFFAIFNFTITHESQIRNRPHVLKHDPSKAPVPKYHPDTPEVRHDWAQYYDRIAEMDAQAGKLLSELEKDGLSENTIIFFYGDHGCGMPRSKRFPYNSGLQVPLIVYVPEKFKHLAPPEYKAGGISERLVSFVDLAPTLLSIVGIKPPEWIEGRPFMGKYVSEPPKYLFGLRGRMDERYDLIRSVRNDRYIYIRNYMPHLIYGQYISYMFQTPTTRIWKQLYDDGKLSPPKTYFWEPKPPEELYDLQNDPDEVNNLANSPAHKGILNELRNALREHILKTRDTGFLSEAEAHTRAQGSTIYEMAHDNSKYPLEKILAMAEAASNLSEKDISRFVKGFDDSDSAVRYWAAMGILMRGSNAVRSARSELQKLLKDNSPSVRIVCAQALGQFGDKEDLSMAISTLKDLASPEKNGAYVSIMALNAIDALGSKAAEIFSYLEKLPRVDKNAPARANEYVGRLLDKILKKESAN